MYRNKNPFYAEFSGVLFDSKLATQKLTEVCKLSKRYIPEVVLNPHLTHSSLWQAFLSSQENTNLIRRYLPRGRNGIGIPTEKEKVGMGEMPFQISSYPISRSTYINAIVCVARCEKCISSANIACIWWIREISGSMEKVGLLSLLSPKK